MFFAEGLLADLSAPVLFCGVDELIAKLEAAKEYTDLRGVSARRIGGGNLSTAGYGGMMFRLLSENSNGLLTSTTAGSLGRHYDEGLWWWKRVAAEHRQRRRLQFC